MTDEQLHSLKYPIGTFSFPKEADADRINAWVLEIQEFPEKIESAVNTLNESQLDTAYRPEGWSIRQVIHHVVDSHLNSYIRFKWTLTESEPMIKVYDEKTWAEEPEASKGPIDISLDLLKSLHKRWTLVLKNLSEQDLQKAFTHPEMNRKIHLYQNIALYAWHCKHHLAHITNLKEREGWV